MYHRARAHVPAQPISELNITPMIDVMLVVLVLMILSLPLPTHKVAVDLPIAAAKPSVPPVVHRLALDANGAAYWDGAPVSRQDLSARLRTLVTDPAKPVLQIEVDAATSYARFDETLALVKLSGVTSMGFAGNEAFRKF